MKFGSGRQKWLFLLFRDKKFTFEFEKLKKRRNCKSRKAGLWDREVRSEKNRYILTGSMRTEYDPNPSMTKRDRFVSCKVLIL